MTSKVRTMYLAVPVILGLSACSVTKDFVFVNSPKDLEYRLGDHSKAISRNVNNGIDNAREKYIDTRIMEFKKHRVQDNCYIFNDLSSEEKLKTIDFKHMDYTHSLNGVPHIHREYLLYPK